MSAGVLFVGGVEPHEWIRLQGAPQMPSLASLSGGERKTFAETFAEREAFASYGGLVRGSLSAKLEDFR